MNAQLEEDQNLLNRESCVVIDDRLHSPATRRQFLLHHLWLSVRPDG